MGSKTYLTELNFCILDCISATQLVQNVIMNTGFRCSQIKMSAHTGEKPRQQTDSQ